MIIYLFPTKRKGKVYQQPDKVYDHSIYSDIKVRDGWAQGARVLVSKEIMSKITGSGKSEEALTLGSRPKSLKGRRGGRIVIGYWPLPKAERRAERAGEREAHLELSEGDALALGQAYDFSDVIFTLTHVPPCVVVPPRHLGDRIGDGKLLLILAHPQDLENPAMHIMLLSPFTFCTL